MCIDWESVKIRNERVSHPLYLGWLTRKKRGESFTARHLQISYRTHLTEHFLHPLKETFVAFLRLGMEILALLQLLQHCFFIGG